jgi:CDP-glucose 4,6-dehydratase
MSYWASKRVLVTGCTGFVGGWLTERLVNEGAAVFGLVWEADPDAHFFRGGLDGRITCVPGDIRDLPLLTKLLSDYDVDTVFHLAAQAIVTKANVSPLVTYETNVDGTWTLLEAVHRTASVRRVVIASSDKVYGDQDDLPYRESNPLCAANPYDVSKACADLIAQSYAKTFSLPLAVVRCGNIYGGGDLNFDRLIPGTIRAALRNENPLVRSDGTFTRDYLYVADAVDAYLLLAQALDQERFHGEAFNFGNERPFTVLEVIARILELMKSVHLAPVVQDVATAEIRHQYLSSTKARDRLGWAPAYTLESGLRETISWYKSFLPEIAPETARA